MEAELTSLDIATVESEWLRELLMDLPMVEKPIPAIAMNLSTPGFLSPDAVYHAIYRNPRNIIFARHNRLVSQNIIHFKP